MNNLNKQLKEELAAPKVLSFISYDAKIPPAPKEGVRLAKCLYKAAKPGSSAEHENAALELALISPEVLLADEKLIQSFIPHFVSHLESVQDKMVKEMHKKGLSKVSENCFSLDAILDYLEIEGVSGRLSKEVIEAWYVEVVESILFDAFAEKLGMNEEGEVSEEVAEKLVLIIETYKKKFVSCASGQVKLPLSEIENLEKALDISGAKNSVVGARIAGRLLKMKEAPKEDLLLAL